MAASAGSVVGWTSPSLPQLMSENSPISITSADSSWIASIMILASIVSVLPAAYMSEIFGRKYVLLSATLPYILGWILILIANSKIELYFSRAISGLGYGIVYTISPVYLGEIASDKVRGSLACMIALMSKVGVLLQYTIGPYVSFRTLAVINISLPLLFVLTFIWQPESPYYFVQIGDLQGTERSLQKLTSKKDVTEEISSIDEFVSEQTKNKGQWGDLIRIHGNRKALFMIMVIIATQQFCGSSAVIAYAQQIFMDAGGYLDSSKSSVLLGVVQLVIAILSVLLVDRIGRKPLLLISSLGVCVTNAIIGTYFYIKTSSPANVENLGWLPIVAILVFIISYTVGLSSVPFAITSEMFPANVKFHASSIIQMFTAFLTFLVTKLYQVVGDAYGTHVTFWSFAVFSLFGFIYILCKLPETKGRSFSNIQENLNRIQTIS